MEPGSTTLNYILILLFVIWGNGLAATDSAADLDEVPHECDRVCIKGESRRCVYDFTMEWYLTLSKACHHCPFNVTDCYRPQCVAADGYRRAFFAANRKLPGPTIMVCEGDEVVVHVHNHLGSGEGTSIHWHGIHQRGTQYMDGANLITQCPISQGSSFTYDFIASPQGTHFWHSHVGFQRGDGLHGAFIIKRPAEEEAHYDLYDHDCDTPSGDCEQILFLVDWLDEAHSSRYSYLMHFIFDVFQPVSALLNGRNHRNEVTDFRDPTQKALTPWEVIDVVQGKRYRFRVINSGSMVCPFKVAIDRHNLTIVAADGSPVKPVQVDAFNLSPGESYDFILEANQLPGNYWIKAWGLIDCSFSEANVYAILRYQGALQEEPEADKDNDKTDGKLLNPVIWTQQFPKSSHGEGNDIPVHELTSVMDEDFTQEQVDVTHYFAMDFNNNDNKRFNHPVFYPVQGLPPQQNHATPVIDNITFYLPPSPLLSQPEDFDPAWKCNRSSLDMEKCYQDLCICTHFVHFDLGQVVELIIVDEGHAFDTGHPMHIHGYNLRILGSAKLGPTTSLAEIKRMNEAGELPRKLINPSYRDTFWVADGGYVIARFIADNPGLWFFHCHVESHIEQGQALLIEVGNPEDVPPVPEGFPRCGSWPGSTKNNNKQPKRDSCPPQSLMSASPGLESLILNSVILSILAACFFNRGAYDMIMI